MRPLPHPCLEKATVQRTLSFSSPADFCEILSPWVIQHIPLIPRPDSDTKSPVFFRPYLQISEVGRERHYLAWRPRALRSLSLDLSVLSIKWRVAVLPRASPPTNPLLILLRSPIRGTEDLVHSQQPVSSGVGCTPQLLTPEPAPSLQALKSPPVPTS